MVGQLRWPPEARQSNLQVTEVKEEISLSGLDPRPDEEGIKTGFQRPPYVGGQVWTHALMKKGLRLVTNLPSNSCWVWTHALMKKGLRLGVGPDASKDVSGPTP